MSEWGDKLLTEADNARLRAENDKLLMELTDLRLESCPSCGIKVENEKLRELVRAAWRCIHTGVSCYDCRLIAGGCTLQSAMRELGIEADA